MEKAPQNFHNLAEQRDVVRHDLQDIGVSPTEITKRIQGGEDFTEYLVSLGGLAKMLGPQMIEELKALQETAGNFSIVEQGGLSGAKERLRADRKESDESRWVDEASIQAELGEDYAKLGGLVKDRDSLQALQSRWLRENKLNPHAAAAREKTMQVAREQTAALDQEAKAVAITNPMAARGLELVSYRRGLHEEGHIAATPTVRRQLRAIGTRLIDGKPMFLHGPTGTGKTSLARLAAKQLTGHEAEMVYCNPQTRESNIWGKTGIKPAAGGAIETVDILGPLARAAKEGRVVVFDEFTALPKEQMVFLKGMFNAKQGDVINIMGNGQVPVAPGFQMMFTANLKSAKNPERQELPPEIAREFEQNNLKIEYTSPAEAYDIMLARLMNPDGSLDFAWHDLNETLPKLCQAMAEIQTAYADHFSPDSARLMQAVDASGKAPGLKKLVLTQGTVENILDAWATARQTGEGDLPFAAFLDQRLATALTFEEYPEADRILAAKILAAKGFLRTLTASDIHLPEVVFNFDAARSLRGPQAADQVRELSAKQQHIPLKKLTELDPFGLRRRQAAEAAEQFLPPSPEHEPGGAISLAEAREVLGDAVFGPEEVKQAFGIEVAQVPPIPFSREILEKLKGTHDLILFSDALPDGSSLTGATLDAHLGGKKKDGTPLLYDKSWYQNEPFFTTASPTLAWKVVSRELISGSTGKNYLEQTDTLIESVSALYPDVSHMPAEIQAAIEEFQNKRSMIEPLIDADWKKAADEIEELKMTQLLRPSFIEELYRIALIDRIWDQRALASTYSWTRVRSSVGEFVRVGLFDADGGRVRRWSPDDRLGYLGSVLCASNL